MKEYQFTLSAVFEAESQDDAWDQWVEWLTNPSAIEDGTEITTLPPVLPVEGE